MSKNKVKILFHLIFWIGWVFFFDKITVFGIDVHTIILLEDGNLSSSHVQDTVPSRYLILFGVFFKIGFTYLILYYLYPKFFSTRRTYFIFLMSTLIVSIFVLEYLFDYVYITSDEKFELPLDIWVKSNILQYGLLVVMISLFIFVNEWMFLDRKLLLLEKEKLNSELAFLKYQINPHLLFNTLNNLFSMSQESNAFEVSKGISKLSNLMRYTLYENKENDVSIKKEIEFIEQFIDLQKLRANNSNDLEVNFQIEGDISKVVIRPFLLIPFVENAFKHGVNLREKSIININLKLINNILSFSVDNHIYRSDKGLTENEGGIGLDNLKKRLKLLYPGTHKIIILEDKDIFTATIILNL